MISAETPSFEENTNPVETNTEFERQESFNIASEDLETIANIDFLKLPPENRLKYITNPNIESSKILSGEISSVEFDFAGNKDLYLKTTAGQVMPAEVRTIETPDGKIWKRSDFSLNGEFFDENNRRLIIGDSSSPEFKGYTGLKVSEIKDTADIEMFIADNVVNYLNNNPDKQENVDIIRASIERGIDPNLAIDIISSLVEGLGELEREAKIEDILTSFERVRGDYNLAEADLNRFLREYYTENRVENIVSKDRIRELIAKHFPFGNDPVKLEEAMRIIGGESAFDTNAVRPFWQNSRGNDLGLFQINDYYQRENMARLGYTPEDMFDIEKNIEVAALAYAERGNTWKPWVAAQNMGLA